jgi:hypothetical protein
MKLKDVRARIVFHPARQTDCVVEVKIVECSYDVGSTLPGAVICCKVEFSPEVIKALRQALKLAKKDKASLTKRPVIPPRRINSKIHERSGNVPTQFA